MSVAWYQTNVQIGKGARLLAIIQEKYHGSNFTTSLWLAITTGHTTFQYKVHEIPSVGRNQQTNNW